MSNNKAPFQISILSAAIAATLFSGYTTAQGATLEEVIVTATRRAESIQDIPINITALGSDLIQRDRLTGLADIARVVPGMTVVDQGPRSGNTLTVRGMSVDSINATDQLNDGGGIVATYLGEIPLYIDLKLNDMERVEVLMGPQGTLYGAGTLGGAVRYIPNKPQTDALSYEVRGDAYGLSRSDGVGSETGGTVNVPIIRDKLALRASLDYLDDPGFIDYNYLVRDAGVSYPQPLPGIPESSDREENLKRKEDANTEETWSGRLALRYTGDMLDSTLSYYYQDMDIGGRQVNYRDSYNTGRYESAARFEEPNERKNELLALEMVADLGFAELTSATGYSEYHENGQRDQTDLLFTLDYGYEYFPQFAAYTRDDGKSDNFTQELRLVSTSDGPLNWIVGAFYNDFQADNQSEEYTPGYDQFLVGEGIGWQTRPDALEYVEKRKDNLDETALFGELGYQLTDAWQVTVGSRWFKYNVDATSSFATPLFDTVVPPDPEEFPDAVPPPQDEINFDTQSEDYDDDDALYKFNTSYQFTDDIMGYLTISEGYRLGGLNSVPACPVPVPPGQKPCALPDEVAFKSDTSTNYELGVRSQYSDWLLLNGNIFFIKWDDVRINDVTENGAIPINSNGGSAESTGIELSAEMFITPELSLMGSYSYTNAELTEDAPCLLGGPDPDPNSDDPDAKLSCAESGGDVNAYDGDRLPGTPENQGYLGANYALPLRDGSRVDFSWSIAAQSDVLTKVGERNYGENLSGYALNYASATWFKDSWTLGLYADNVFDKYTETGVRTDTSYIGRAGETDTVLRRYYHNVGRPRQVGLRFTYRFDE